jgi:hypothetical protein
MISEHYFLLIFIWTDFSNVEFTTFHNARDNNNSVGIYTYRSCVGQNLLGVGRVLKSDFGLPG